MTLLIKILSTLLIGLIQRQNTRYFRYPVWRHRSRDHPIPHRPFPIGGPLEPRASNFNDFRDIQWQMWCNDWHDLVRPLNKGQNH